MKHILSTIFAVFCLITIGQVAGAYTHTVEGKRECVSHQIDQHASFDAEVIESEEVLDPVLSTSELPNERQQARWSSLDASPHRGDFLDACLTRTPRYIMVRRLLI